MVAVTKAEDQRLRQRSRIKRRILVLRSKSSWIQTVFARFVGLTVIKPAPYRASRPLIWMSCVMTLFFALKVGEVLEPNSILVNKFSPVYQSDAQEDTSTKVHRGLNEFDRDI
jgi:hypothetical protein